MAGMRESSTAAVAPRSVLAGVGRFPRRGRTACGGAGQRRLRRSVIASPHSAVTVRTAAPSPQPETAQARVLLPLALWQHERYQMVTDLEILRPWVLTPPRVIGDIPAQPTSNQVVRAVIGFARSVPWKAKRCIACFVRPAQCAASRSRDRSHVESEQVRYSQKERLTWN
jgi:hypothetical protein